MKKHVFTLYIAGQTARSQRAVSNLQAVCQENDCDYDLHIIDVLESPEEANKAKVIAIPTLIKEAPPPPTRIIGDLSDRDALKAELNIND